MVGGHGGKQPDGREGEGAAGSGGEWRQRRPETEATTFLASSGGGGGLWFWAMEEEMAGLGKMEGWRRASDGGEGSGEETRRRAAALDRGGNGSFGPATSCACIAIDAFGQ